MDSIADAQSRVQHAQLYLQVLEENLKLRKEIGRLEEEQRLLKNQAQSLSECTVKTHPPTKVDIPAEVLRAIDTRINELTIEVEAQTKSLETNGLEMQKIIVQYDALMAENLKLKDALGHLCTETTNEKLMFLEESNRLWTDLLTEKDNFRAHVKETDVLKEQVKALNLSLEQNEVQLQTANCELQKSYIAREELERNLAATKLEYDSRQQAMSSRLEDSIMKLLNTNRENRELREKVSQQESEIQQLRKGEERVQSATHLHESDAPQPTTITQTPFIPTHLETNEASSSQLRQERRAQSSVSKKRQNRFDLSWYASPVTPYRQAVLDTLPVVDAILPDGIADVYFTKTMLTRILGGAHQSLIVSITKSAKTLALKWNVNMYICPQVDMNRWLPTSPGRHGFMQVGLGREKNTFVSPVISPLFVGVDSRFKYSGLYDATRVDPLAADEWNALPEQVKLAYSQITWSKEKNEHNSVAQVRNKYDSGLLHMPCVLLKCVRFDTDFCNELASAAQDYNANNVSHAPITNSKRPPTHEEALGAPGSEYHPSSNKRPRRQSTPGPGTSTGVVRKTSGRISLILRTSDEGQEAASTSRSLPSQTPAPE